MRRIHNTSSVYTLVHETTKGQEYTVTFFHEQSRLQGGNDLCLVLQYFLNEEAMHFDPRSDIEASAVGDMLVKGF